MPTNCIASNHHGSLLQATWRSGNHLRTAPECTDSILNLVLSINQKMARSVIFFKMEMDLNNRFKKENIRMDKQHLKWSWTSVYVRNIQIKVTVRYPLHVNQDSKTRLKTDSTQYCCRWGESWLLVGTSRHGTVQPLWKLFSNICYNGVCLQCNPAILLEELHIYIHLYKNIYRTS